MTREEKLSGIFILDATAFYAGIPYLGIGRYKTTRRVLKEVTHSSKYATIINTLIDSRRIEVEEPPTEVYLKIRQKAEEIKHLPSLSEADLSVLALALHHSKTEHTTIVTDDYAIQNLASILNINFSPTMTRGIKKVVRWILYCPGCGTRHIENRLRCPSCGTPLKRRFEEIDGDR